MVYYNNIMNFTKDDTKTQILSTVQIYNVLCNNVLNAVILIFVLLRELFAIL